MPAGITSASARGGYAQGGIGSERAGRPLRLSCQLVVGAQGVAYAAMKVALNSGPRATRLKLRPSRGAMGNGRFNVAVSFDERRGYVGTHPELRSPVTALSLGGLRRRIEIALLPEVDVDIRLELDRGARLERDRRRLQGRPRRPHA